MVKRVKFSLRYKISIYVAILLVITMGLLYLYVSFFGKNILLEQLELRYITLGNKLANTCKLYILEENLNELKSILMEVLKENKIITLYISSKLKNYPLLKMHKAGSEEIIWVGNPIKDIYYSKNTTLKRGIKYSQINTKIVAEKKELATLRIIYSNQEVIQKINKLSKDIVFIFFVVLGVGLIGVIILSNFIVNPIIKMAEEVGLVGKGDLTREIRVKTNDEIKLLAENFNQMVTDVRKAKKEVEDYSKFLEEKVEERTKELQKAHEQIVQSEKMAALGQLASSVSHELRNPLGAIKLVIYYLKNKLSKDDSSLIKHVEDINDSLNSAQRIVSNILSFSRPSDLIISEVDINETIEKILESSMYKRLLENVRVKKELKIDLPLIKVDKDQIIQVIENLLINAVQAISEKGEIFINSALDTDNGTEVVRINIKDNGCGIYRGNMKNLFEPFFSVNKPKGIGLGLFICKNIIEKHKGKILVSSEVNKGSIFSILLPVSSEVN